jgi:hypothetical protein
MIVGLLYTTGSTAARLNVIGERLQPSHGRAHLFGRWKLAAVTGLYNALRGLGCRFNYVGHGPNRFLHWITPCRRGL